MYRYTVKKLLNESILTEIINDFKINYIPRFDKLERYYNAKNKILERYIEPPKPNNKLAHGFCKYITNMATSYFVGKPIRYIVDGEEPFKDALTDILNDNYTDSMNFEIAKEMSKCGISYEVLFINEKGKLKSQKFTAKDIIPIYSNSMGEFLTAAIRIWSEQDIDQMESTEYAAVYTDSEIWTFKKKASQTVYELLNVEKHMFDDVPVLVYWNNEEQKGDYEDVISLIDAYDKTQSDTANDFEYFTDAYLLISGAGGGIVSDDEEEREKASRTLREERILYAEDGDMKWLIKDVNDTAVENYKNRLYKDIFFLSQVPALSDESFSGNLSGVAIRYKLSALEELAISKENKFRAAQQKKLKLITAFINTKFNKSYDYKTVTQKYERNFIDNTSEVIEDVAKLEGIVSRETQLEMLPMVENPTEELERINQEKLNEEDLPKTDYLFEGGLSE